MHAYAYILIVCKFHSVLCIYDDNTRKSPAGVGGCGGRCRLCPAVLGGVSGPCGESWRSGESRREDRCRTFNSAGGASEDIHLCVRQESQEGAGKRWNPGHGVQIAPATPGSRGLNSRDNNAPQAAHPRPWGLNQMGPESGNMPSTTTYPRPWGPNQMGSKSGPRPCYIHKLRALGSKFDFA